MRLGAGLFVLVSSIFKVLPIWLAGILVVILFLLDWLLSEVRIAEDRVE